MSGIVNFQSLSGGKSGRTGSLPRGCARGYHNNIAGSQSDFEAANYGTVLQGSQTYFINSTGRFTAPVQGHYYFSCHGTKNNHDPVGRLYIRKNNVTSSGVDESIQIRSHGAPDTNEDAANYAQGHVSTIFQLDAGEYVSVWTSSGYFIGNDSQYGTFSWQFVST